MANRYAVATGNWSNTATWDGGTLPGAGDTVRPNTYTVTIDQDLPTGCILTNNASAPAAAGGGFVCSTTRDLGGTTITAAGSGANLLTLSGAGTTISNVGNVTGSSAGAQRGVIVTANNVTLTCGTVTGGTGNSSAFGVDYGATSGFTLNCTAITAATVGPCLSGSGANVTINTGPVTGASVDAINITGSGAINVTGDVTGGTSGQAIDVASSTHAITVIGDVIAGTQAAIFVSTSSVSLDIQGEVIASTGSAAVVGSGTGAIVRVLGPIRSASNGRLPFSWSGQLLFHNAQDILWEARDDDNAPIGGSSINLTNYPDGIPDAADVRSGTTFGVGGALTGTLAVPNPSAVSIGVPTDDTVGTAALTPADVWDVDTATLTTADSIGKRLKNVSTVDTTSTALTETFDTP